MTWRQHQIGVIVRTRGFLRRGAAALALAAASLSLTGGAASASTPPWRTVPGPVIPAGDSGNLTGLSMTGPSSGWAVGFVFPTNNANFTPFAARWDGHHWLTARLPSGLPRGVRLNGVAALSPADAWAVGDAAIGSATPLILHWDGRRWAQVPAAPVPGRMDAELLSVAVHSPDDAWAVGDAEDKAQRITTVTEHWNGHRWRLVPSPSHGPDSSLAAVTIASDGSAWAAGSTDQARPFVLRWSGRAWVPAATPRPARGGVLLESITAVSPTQVWAVGETGTLKSPLRLYTLRWNGHTWRSVDIPNPGSAHRDHDLFAVTAIGHGQLAAVGEDEAGSFIHAQWDGRRWTVTVGPRNGSQLNAVSVDGHQLWAVGTRDVPDGQVAFVPLVQERG
jgi:hypothetical protein